MKQHFDPLQIPSGYLPDQDTLSAAIPLHQTAAYVFKDTQHAADLFELNAEGYIYSRISNPTVSILEQRIAALEDGIGGLAVGSGHAAQFLVINNLIQGGKNLVSSPYLYGGTLSQFKHSFKNLGIEVRIADSDAAEDFEALIDENTRGLYMETISNPGFTVPDFEAFRILSEKYEIPIVVDNTFAGGGYLCQPLQLGAHIVVADLSSKRITTFSPCTSGSVDTRMSISLFIMRILHRPSCGTRLSAMSSPEMTLIREIIGD